LIGPILIQKKSNTGILINNTIWSLELNAHYYAKKRCHEMKGTLFGRKNSGDTKI
jgi:hypothetical protein